MRRARVLLIVAGGFAVGSVTNSPFALFARVFMATAATEKRLWLRLSPPHRPQVVRATEPPEAQEVLLRFVWLTWLPVAIIGLALLLNGSPLGVIPLVGAAGLAVWSYRARTAETGRHHLAMVGALALVLLLGAIAQKLGRAHVGEV